MKVPLTVLREAFSREGPWNSRFHSLSTFADGLDKHWMNKRSKRETPAFSESLLWSRNCPSCSGPVYANFTHFVLINSFWWKVFPQVPWFKGGVAYTAELSALVLEKVHLPLQIAKLSMWLGDQALGSLICVVGSWETNTLEGLDKIEFYNRMGAGEHPSGLPLANLCHEQLSWPFPGRRISVKHTSKLPLWWLWWCEITITLGKKYKLDIY